MFLIMKNVVKKLFSLLLVGVVAISMFIFVAPPPPLRLQRPQKQAHMEL